jgi:hypothetical protein
MTFGPLCAALASRSIASTQARTKDSLGTAPKEVRTGALEIELPQTRLDSRPGLAPGSPSVRVRVVTSADPTGHSRRWIVEASVHLGQERSVLCSTTGRRHTAHFVGESSRGGIRC